MPGIQEPFANVYSGELDKFKAQLDMPIEQSFELLEKELKRVNLLKVGEKNDSER